MRSRRGLKARGKVRICLHRLVSEGSVCWGRQHGASEGQMERNTRSVVLFGKLRKLALTTGGSFQT